MSIEGRPEEERSIRTIHAALDARMVDPQLTTVRQPMRLLGERACARLLDRIAYPGIRPAVELLPTELVLRSSCGCPPGTIARQAVKTLKPAPPP